MMDACTPHVPIWEKFFIDKVMLLKPLSYFEYDALKEGQVFLFLKTKKFKV